MNSTYDQKKNFANKVNNEEECSTNVEYASYAFCIQKSDMKLIGWFIDSGASCHITNNPDFFTWIDKTVRQSVTVANGEVVWSSGKGNGKIIVKSSNCDKHEIVIQDVMYIPEVNANLLSVKKLTSKGYDVNFSANECVIKYGENIVVTAQFKDGLYKINEDQCYSLFPSIAKCVLY